MKNDPGQATDRHARGSVMVLFAIVLGAVVIAAFITTIVGVDTRHASKGAQPGTIGLAKPHPPLDKAPGEAIRN